MIEQREIDLLTDLFEEKFKGLHIKMDAEFTVINTQLTQIKEQTTKTNGRVSELEPKVQELQLREVTHYTECPNVKKIDDINGKLLEYNFFMKHPKTVIAGIAVVCFFMIATSLLTLEKFSVSANTIKNNKQNIEQNIKADSLIKR